MCVEDFVDCPKCGFNQPASDECLSCGIIFKKYWALHGKEEASPATSVEVEVPSQPSSANRAVRAPSVADSEGSAELPEGGRPLAAESAVQPYQLEDDPSAQVNAPESVEDVPGGRSMARQSSLAAGASESGSGEAPLGSASPPPSPRPRQHRVLRQDTPGEQPIGAATMVIRSLAGIACLGIAVLMFANGKGLLSVWPYVIMVFYAGAALWGLSSFRQKISLQQFATEMALLVLVTLAMRVAAPEMFSVESPTQGTPKVVQPYLPQSALGSFTKRVLSYVEAGRGILEARDEMATSQWETWTKEADFAAVKSKYSVLTTEDRARVWDVWKRVEELGPMLTDLISRYAVSGGENVRFKAPENERAAVRRELDAALLKASQLRARLLIYPEVDSDY